MPTPPLGPDLESVPCNLCGSRDAAELETRARWGQAMRNVVCRRCGLVYADPRLGRAALERFYAEHVYVQYLSAGGEFDPHLVDESSRHANDAFTFFRGHAGRDLAGASLLEIGCGLGHFLSRARDAGARVLGIEMEGPYADYATGRLGLPVVQTRVEDLPADQRVDVIAAFHVIEHLEDPAAVLRSLHARLSPGGRLFIEVPDIMAAWQIPPREFLRQEHLYNFSIRTLTALLGHAGFRVVARDDARYLLRVAAERVDEAPPVDLAALDGHAAEVRRHFRAWGLRSRVLQPLYALRRALAR
ncbi:MAG: class I SAM-dependent methyltransferase [Vicinamibacterales bacterium]